MHVCWAEQKGQCNKYTHMTISKIMIAAASMALAAYCADAQTIYKIECVYSGKVLDVEGASAANGARVQQWDSNDGNQQRWTLESAGNGTFAIRNRSSGKVLDVDGGSYDNGAQVHQWDDIGADNERWWIEDVGDGTKIIRSVSSGLVLEIEGESSASGAGLQQWEYWGGAHQQWRLIETGTVTPPGPPLSYDPQITYRIEAVHSGQVLDVGQASLEERADIIQCLYHGGANQHWTIEAATNGAVLIRSINSGKVLDVGWASTADGADIFQCEYWGGSNQLWLIEDAGNGTVLIRNLNSNKVLDVAGASGAMGADVIQATYWGADNQRWRIVPVFAPPVASIAVDNFAHGDSVQAGAIVTVRYRATDSDGNLRGIRYNIWNASTGYIDNGDVGDGGWVPQSGTAGEVAKVFTLGTAGDWYFWTDACDANGNYSTTGNLYGGFKIVVGASGGGTPEPLSVTFTSPVTAQIGVGGDASFRIASTSSLEIGLVRCDQTGARIETVKVLQSQSGVIRWLGTKPSGSYYFKAYAVGADGLTVYTPIQRVDITSQVVVTQYIAAETTLRYNADNFVRVAGGQYIDVDSMTGYVTRCRLTMFDPASARFIERALAYAPDKFTVFQPNTVVRFSEGLVSDGFMDNPGDYIILPYGPDRTTRFKPRCHIKFKEGYVSDGYMANAGTNVTLQYGPGRSTKFFAQSHVKFRGGYVSDGYMKNDGTYETLPYGSEGTARFMPQCHVTFADGYVATGFLVDNGYNVYPYRTSGGMVKIRLGSGGIIRDYTPVANALKRIDDAWGAIMTAMATTQGIVFLSSGDISVMEGSMTISLKKYMDQLSAAEAAATQLPLLYSQYDPYTASYRVNIQYPPVGFTPGPDGRGYLAVAQLAETTTLRTASGSSTVAAGTVCAFIDGYYVP